MSFVQDDASKSWFSTSRAPSPSTTRHSNTALFPHTFCFRNLSKSSRNIFEKKLWSNHPRISKTSFSLHITAGSSKHFSKHLDQTPLKAKLLKFPATKVAAGPGQQVRWISGRAV